jgi:hypothetical protein
MTDTAAGGDRTRSPERPARRRTTWLAEPNPVLVKELRARFRGPRPFVLVTVFLLLISAAAWLALQALLELGAAASLLGLVIIQTLEVLGVMLLGPILTAGAIAGEKERQTWELLLATPLSGHEIVRGKVGAAMAYVALLAFCALPVLSLGLLVGGVSLLDIVSAQLAVVAAGFVYTSLGALLSVLSSSTSRAIVGSYAAMFLMLCGGLCATPVSMSLSTGVFVGGNWDNPMAVGGGAMALAQLFSAATSLLLGLVFLLAAGSRARPGGRPVAVVVVALLLTWWALSFISWPLIRFLVR